MRIILFYGRKTQFLLTNLVSRKKRLLQVQKSGTLDLAEESQANNKQCTQFYFLKSMVKIAFAVPNAF